MTAPGTDRSVRVDRRGRIADPQLRVAGDVLAHQCEGHDAQLEVAYRGADEPDGAFPGADRRAGCGQFVGGHAVQVQQHEPARRAPQVVYPGDRLLTPVAALVQVYRGGGPAHLGRQRPVVGLEPVPWPAGRDPHRLVRPDPGERYPGGGHDVLDRPTAYEQVRAA